MRKKIPQIPITQVTENGFTYWVADPHIEECPKISADQYHAANLKLNRLKVGLSVVILIVGIINIILTLIK